jgi:starch synthase (maltosyl-transferring)
MTKLPAARPSRVVIEPVAPVVDGGRFAAKVALGEAVVVVADVFGEGHDAVDAAVRWRQVAPARAAWEESPLTFQVNDRWTGGFTPDALGRWEYQVVGWSAGAATWRNGIRKKIAADVDVTVERLDGMAVAERLLARAGRARPKQPDHLGRLEALRDALRSDDTATLDALLADDAAGGESWDELFWLYEERSPTAKSEIFAVDVDPERGRFSAWYEFFPRSTVGAASGHGTLRDAVDRLDRIARMGFDVVYLPPIHPIGTVNRKGANNSTEAAPDDVGSPWGIQDHLVVHPELGTVDDVRDLAGACRARGIELALDIAFQCTPDHVWVDAHPDWFKHRADGTIQYAETPPKKYQDIYPIDFETDDWQALWTALADVFRFWIGHGVTIFRVDNPHTKAFPFWEWCMETIRSEHPETIFLAEAFTRPRVMERLAKLGFNQSYTYFTWRRAGWELREYYTDLATRTVDYYRPNSWPNTPDILTDQLQHGGRATFISRAILAATLSANWGIYGPAFELLEHRAVAPGSEEYLDSEKYQIRRWDLDDTRSIEPLITRLNEIRRAEPALQHLRTLRFHDTDSAGLLCYSKTDPAGVGDPILVVVNLSGSDRHAGNVHVDPTSLGIGLGHDDPYEVVDLLGGGVYRWHGWHNYVDLTPGRGAAHIFAARRIEEPA